MIHEHALWSDVNDIKRFTQNTTDNKRKRAKKTSSIILAAIQYTQNYLMGLKKQNAYDAASIIFSDANWIKNGDKTDFIEHGVKKKVKIGYTYYIDYGNNFNGEIGYYHHGLCIGKNNDKVLIVPTITGANIFANCYHPINNPNSKRNKRQALKSEGFNKDCVLLINDTKYISAGRIDKR